MLNKLRVYLPKVREKRRRIDDEGFEKTTRIILCDYFECSHKYVHES